jgi:DNA ligase-1
LELKYATSELQATNSSNKKKFWQGFVVERDEETIVYYTSSWHELGNGKLSKKNRSEFTEILGKNIGRSNETTPLEQAISELKSLMNKKFDEGYYIEGIEADILPLPMLAHKFVERGNAIEYPCFVQPKLDGHRALYDGEKFWTRKGKLYLPDVVKHLRFNTHGYIVDGEIMLPPGYTFQETTSAIKKCNKNTPELQYHVFDVIGNEATFTERIDKLEEILTSEQEDNLLPDNVYLVKTILCGNEFEVSGWLSKALTKGYEGIMLRNSRGI